MYIDGVKVSDGGTFKTDGTFNYWVGTTSAVNIDSVLELEGLDVDNKVIVNTVQVTVQAATT